MLWYLVTEGPVLAVLAFGLGIWLFVATAQEWASRIKLFRAPFSESLRRARNLPRASHGMTLAHLGLAVCIFGFVGSSAWKEDLIARVDARVHAEAVISTRMSILDDGRLVT